MNESGLNIISGENDRLSGENGKHLIINYTRYIYQSFLLEAP